jgi:hypothetical protein
MSSSVKEPTRSTDAPLVPPDEQFWQRYSPHGELPLSGATSLALHVVPLVVLLLFGGWLASHLFKPTRKVPVEPVRLAINPGGGGDPRGKGDGPGVGESKEEAVEGTPDAPAKTEPPPKRPSLSRPEVSKAVEKTFTPSAVRYLRKNETDNTRAYVQLEEGVRSQLRRGLSRPAGKGKGGPGSGGGTGSGKGTGKGSGKGPGQKATLTQREKRMLRWQMRFAANNGPQYLAQLRALGAILAIPINGEYQVVRNLQPPARPQVEDLSAIQRIYWIDDNPRSVRDVMAALGLRIATDRFVAFMPQELEDKLFEMEKKAMIKRKGHFNEDEIYETVFRVVPGGRGYTPVLSSITFKRGR